MEKSFEEILVQFYVDQYRENAKRSTGKPVKLASGNKKACIDYLLFQQ